MEMVRGVTSVCMCGTYHSSDRIMFSDGCSLKIGLRWEGEKQKNPKTPILLNSALADFVL